MNCDQQKLEESKAYYDQRFGNEEGHPSRLTLDETYRWNVIETVLKKIVAEHPVKTLQILDFGCGRGWLSQKLTAFGQVTGVDLSPESIKRAAGFFPEVTFKVINAAEPVSGQLPAGTFDIVISSEVIEHVLNQPEYINNISTLLKPGGILLMTTPNARWYDYHFYKERIMWKQPVEQWLSKESIFEMLNPRFNIETLNTFHAHWIHDYRTFGLPGLLGNSLWRKGLTLFGLKKRYLQWLEKKGFGLYHIVCARKK
jgi:2-polyprenyl-3-methyl-5-hydroxy-6-metoxy-1,4-benzoquinol methylase